MLSLSALAGWEEAVLASIRGASGTLEERDRQIERSGLYGEYPAIVRAYLELRDDGDSGLEATKRAVFLVWRGAMAPPMETGIGPLPDGTSRATVEQLDHLLRRGAGDEELAWMLAWYHAEGGHVFELFGATRRVVAFAQGSPPDAWRRAGITADSMRRRGQLGLYWSTLAAGAP
jgi:hypothetical protein